MTQQAALISQSNAAYYQTSEPILTDQEFDLLADNGLAQDSRNWRNKVEHALPMGSLAKVKTAADLARWLRQRPHGLVIVTPKLDGNSIALSYCTTRLERAATRGDGQVGNDVTPNISKARAIRALPLHPLLPGTVEARAEAIIPKRYSSEYDKNLRNVAAGIINAKEPRPNLAQVQLMIFDLHSDTLVNWMQKRSALKALPAEFVPPFMEFRSPDPDALFDELTTVFEQWSAPDFPFAIDGLVVQALEDELAPLPEPAMEPPDKIAVKFNGAGVAATIGAIEWNLGKHGKLAPVLILADGGVEIDGTTVRRVSASNYALLSAAGLGMGAQVEVVKSGDIIPFVSAVVTPSQQGIDALPCCPACDATAVLSPTGVDALCPNEECEGKERVMLQKTFALFGIDFVSEATIDKLAEAGYDSLEKLFALTVDDLVALDGFAVKSAQYFVKALHNATLSEAMVIKAAGFKGIGERKGTMLLNHYGSLDALLDAVRREGLADIPNFGPIQKDLLEQRIEEVASVAIRLATLGVTITPHQTVTSRLNVCATGACPGITRTELEALLKRQGYTLLSSVTKECNLLLCEDASGSSSKLQKARQLGVNIQSYADFLAGL